METSILVFVKTFFLLFLLRFMFILEDLGGKVYSFFRIYSLDSGNISESDLNLGSFIDQFPFSGDIWKPWKYQSEIKLFMLKGLHEVVNWSDDFQIHIVNTESQAQWTFSWQKFRIRLEMLHLLLIVKLLPTFFSLFLCKKRKHLPKVRGK